MPICVMCEEKEASLDDDACATCVELVWEEVYDKLCDCVRHADDLLASVQELHDEIERRTAEEAE